ncbi:hypothetical protein BH11MYX1_BH11MYX1_34640 [soil metagenome]
MSSVGYVLRPADDVAIYFSYSPPASMDTVTP